MEQSDSEIKKYYRLKKWEYAILFGLVGIAFAAPYFFTQFNLGPSFTKTGEIGDTIGGLTAPFISLAAGFLVYKSFSAQIQANLDQRNNHDKQMKLIRKEQAISSLTYLFKEIESTIDTNENKYKDAEGTIGHMLRSLEAFNLALNNTARVNHEEYVERKEKLISKQLAETIHLVVLNINHLKVLTNLMSNFNQDFSGENNTAELIHFFGARIYVLIKKLNYHQLLEDPLCSLEEKIKFENPYVKHNLKGCRGSLNMIFRKLEVTSMASMI